MKKITIIIADDEPISFDADFLARAIEFHIETVGEVKKPKRTHRGRDGLTCLAAVMKHYTPEGIFTKALSRRWVFEQGFNPNSAGPAISSLKRSGHLKEIEPQRYQFLKPFTA